MRTIKPAELKALLERQSITLLDVRRKSDRDASANQLPGATWSDPELVDQWSRTLPKTTDVVIYCVRGGSVSNSIVDKLQAQGIPARFIEGGIEAWAQAGGATIPRSAAPA